MTQYCPSRSTIKAQLAKAETEKQRLEAWLATVPSYSMTAGDIRMQLWRVERAIELAKQRLAVLR